MTSTTIQQQRKGRRAHHIPHICLSLQQAGTRSQNAMRYLYLSNTREESHTMSQQANQVNNQLRGTIRSILEGQLLSEVVLDTRAGPMTSVVSTNLIRSQNLMPGSEVVALIPATEIALSRT
jgi:molybdopterin-binding protein